MKPHILTGPSGSYLQMHHGISTADAFRNGKEQAVKDMLAQYRLSGSTTGVTPTFGAGNRWRRSAPAHSGTWLPSAMAITREIFDDHPILASIAPLLDTSGGDDGAWGSHPRRERIDMAHRLHAENLSQAHDAGLPHILIEAVHDLQEAIGAVMAADGAGIQSLTVSFEPTRDTLPHGVGNHKSYAHVLDHLRSIARRVEVCIGLNCGNARQILRILQKTQSETFSIVYPNQACIPLDDRGTNFRLLADQGESRDPEGQARFDGLCRAFDLSHAMIERIVKESIRHGVSAIGLCCGATPQHIFDLANKVNSMTV